MERKEKEDLDMSVVDVYDLVTDFAKEFRPIIGIYGAEPFSNVMAKIITILECLESQAMKIGKLNSIIQEQDGIIMKLEKDKAERSADRHRFEKEMEVLEENWRSESQDFVQTIGRLQEENKKLKWVSEKQDSKEADSLQSPEIDIGALTRSQESNEKLREQIKCKDKFIHAKQEEIDQLTNEIAKLNSCNKDLKKKLKLSQNQTRNLIEERADLLTQLQDKEYAIIALKKCIRGEEKLSTNVEGKETKHPKNTAPENEDEGKPTFTTSEVKDILRERNEFKARLSDLQDELTLLRPVKSPSGEVVEENEEDAPVQGPLPFEPHDAPWRRSESSIRKLFKKIFTEANVNFLGSSSSSPKRSLSTLTKITKSSGTTHDSI